jgi:predicted transcriptional regulator
MAENGFSIVPVYLKKTLAGVINRKMIVDAIGSSISAGVSVDKILSQSVADTLDVLNVSNHYEVVPSSITIDTVIFMFQQNRKLSTVIITKNGNYNEEPMGVVVTSDTIDLQNTLDNY